MPDSADYQARLALSNRLLALPPPQLDQVVFALKPAPGNIPPNTAKPGDRVAALLEWAESPIGPGLPALEAALDQVISAAAGAAGPASSAIASRRDVHIGKSLDHSSVVSGDGNRVEIHHHYGLPDQKPDATRKDRNEKTLIEAVWTEVEDRLRQSLHNAILIRLDMAEQRNQVSRPWDSELRTADQGITTLAPGTHIAEVFDRRDVGGKLLILGNPGAGKTTTMLDLAAVLIQRANDQPDEPIPVMFNLSSWQNEKQSITDWLLGELKLKYGVSPKLGKTWLSEKMLLPLLDGLDELPPQRQEPVVAAMNGWLQSGEGPTRLLVCSRIEEYELYAAKLALNGAICLEPLTDKQLQDYLGSMNMAALWESLQQDAALLALVRTPLLLSVSILANEAIDAEQWRQQQTTQARMDYLLDAYVEQQLHRAVNSREYAPRKQPSKKYTRHQLTWLANILKGVSIDEFSTDELQPEILTKKQQKIYLITNAIGVGILVSAIHYLLLFLFTNLFLDGILPDPANDIMTKEIATKISEFQYLGLWRGAGWSAIPAMILGASLGFRVGQKKIEFTESLDFNNLKTKTFRNWLENGINMISAFVFTSFLSGNIISLNSPTQFLIRNGNIKVLWEFKENLAEGDMTIGINFGNYVTYPVAIAWIVFWILFIVFKGLNKPILVKNTTNQGNLKNLVLIIDLWLFLSSLILALCLWRSSLNQLVESIFPLMPVVFLCAGLMSFASIGLPCFQHCVLRLLLFGNRDIPWNYARFLNHCTDRLLLQRVGGRYRFIHKLVQEHFAAMPLSR